MLADTLVLYLTLATRLIDMIDMIIKADTSLTPEELASITATRNSADKRFDDLVAGIKSRG